MFVSFILTFFERHRITVPALKLGFCCCGSGWSCGTWSWRLVLGKSNGSKQNGTDLHLFSIYNKKARDSGQTMINRRWSKAKSVNLPLSFYVSDYFWITVCDFFSCLILLLYHHRWCYRLLASVLFSIQIRKVFSEN